MSRKVTVESTNTQLDDLRARRGRGGIKSSDPEVVGVSPVPRKETDFVFQTHAGIYGFHMVIIFFFFGNPLPLFTQLADKRRATRKKGKGKRSERRASAP
ncbi:hypothetical protein LY78DRAFT_65137 [Colletotrichum sublineola]|nr:hypothetical protein LY78DRAFT_65137 [Colletotrichum sublineola]